jgi:PmbA protein
MERILQTLRELRKYALDKGYELSVFYHEEDSYLMRFANSSISLNTNEHLIRMEFTAYAGRKRASYELITDLGKLDEMKQGIDIAAAMVQHAQPLTYQPTIPVLSESFSDESAFDASLAKLSNEERLKYFNTLSAGLETEAIKLSGIFSCGMNIVAQINTRSEHTLFFKTSDAQVSAVLAHNTLKWEVTAEQSANKLSELNADALHEELAFLLEHYQSDTPQQIPLGSYDIVFGSAAIADMLNFMNWIGFNGGSLKRGFSFLGEDKVGQKVFSDRFTVVDDPYRLETFPFKCDLTGIVRKAFPIFLKGVFQGFTWYQDDADEFSVKATGHTVMHKSLVFSGGDRKEINSLHDLVDQPRKKDILYIPFLHYMNIVNPSKGIITGSSRFGALMLKPDGSVVVPYNVRLTQSLLDVFGDKVAWLSRATIAYNTSMSYGARNPTAIIVPKFMCVNDLEISHSNSSY